MLGENSFVKFWGGLQKKRTETEEERRKRKGGGVGGNESSDSEEDEGEEGGGKADLAGMAKQIDLEQIERVLSVSRPRSAVPVRAADPRRAPFPAGQEVHRLGPHAGREGAVAQGESGGRAREPRLRPADSLAARTTLRPSRRPRPRCM